MKHILIVEDDKIDQMMIIKSFDKICFDKNIMILQNGEEFIDFISKKGKYKNINYDPDLILLDLNMPKIDGKTALLNLQQHQLHTKTIVILSTSNDKEDIDKCYSLGIKSYILKPNNVEEYEKTIKNICKYWFETVTLP